MRALPFSKVAYGNLATVLLEAMASIIRRVTRSGWRPLELIYYTFKLSPHMPENGDGGAAATNPTKHNPMPGGCCGANSQAATGCCEASSEPPAPQEQTVGTSHWVLWSMAAWWAFEGAVKDDITWVLEPAPSSPPKINPVANTWSSASAAGKTGREKDSQPMSEVLQVCIVV